MPLNLFLIGTALVTGGAIVDMGATIICCPGLEREGNPLILMLISEKVPLTIIYAAMALMNLIEGAIQLVLFACFLKSYPILVKSIPYKNILVTLKWLLGLSNIQNWKEIFMIRKSDFFFGVSSFAFLWVTQSFYRFYMALMWFEKVPYSFQVVPWGIVGVSILGLGFLIHYHVTQRHESELKLHSSVKTSK